MDTIAAAPTLLDLLREAGEEAVTFEELELVGIDDPALALWELELAGFTVQRVFDERKLCVRLCGDAPAEPAPLFAFAAPRQETIEMPAVTAAAETPVVEAAAAQTPPVETQPVEAPAAAVASAPDRRPLLVAAFALLLLVLFARRGR